MSEIKAQYKTEAYITQESIIEAFMKKTGFTRDMIVAIDTMIVGSENAIRVRMNDGDQFIYIHKSYAK